MDYKDTVLKLLASYKNNEISSDDFITALHKASYTDLGFANLDHDRSIRQGFPEVVYCEGKTAEQSALIIQALLQKHDNILGTRADYSKYVAVKELVADAQYYPQARLIKIERKPLNKDNERFIAVVTAGTSDLPVAEEAALTAEAMGNNVVRVYDVGVAGIHRLFEKLDVITKANVLIVAAGMEGALVSVVGGLVNKPVIALPTSVGYGANFNGLSALLGMLNSCASGVAVVNIDNGFGAGRMASIINHMR